MKQLTADIKNRDFKNAYLLTGDEAFLKRSYKNQLKTAIVGNDDMNYSYFEGKDTDETAVIEFADTLPFFGDSRLVIIEDSGWFKSGHDRIVNYLDSMPDTTHIVFVESEVDKRNKLYKKISETGYISDLSHPDIKTLAKWAAGLLAKNGKKIRESDMELILDRTGNDMERVKNEIDKLIAYTEGREIVERADVEAVVTVTAQNKVFDMVRAVTSGQKKQAMDMYEDLLALKEPPMRIVYLISRQFDQLLQVKDGINESMTKEEIASKLKVPPFAAEKMMRQVRNIERSRLLSYVKQCVELEQSVKLGNMPDRLAVELLLCM